MNRSEAIALYRRLGPLIYRRCFLLLGDAEEARDATQEVFVRTLRQAPKLSGDRPYLPWLYRVATNHCLDRLRLRRPTTPFEYGEMPDPYSLASPERRVGQRRVLEGLLAQLDQRGQQIAVLAFADGMTQEEIAEVLQLSRRTVGKRLKRIKSLARRLATEQGLVPDPREADASC